MENDDRTPKISRRQMLRSSAAAAAASAYLVACGTAPTTTTPAADTPVAQVEPTAAPPTTAPTTAPTATTAPTTAAATTAPTTAAATTVATEAAAAPTVAPTVAPTNTPAPLPVGQAGRITVIHRTEYFKEVETKFRDLVTEYVASQGAELDISTANPEVFGDFTAKVQAAVAAGNPPDLAYTTLSIQQLAFLETVEDVTDVVDQAVASYGDVVPLTAAKNAQIDGRWMSVPFMSNSGAWFARRDALETAGIDPTTLTTWDSRREAALAMSDPDNELWGWGLTINKSGDGHGVIMGVIQAFGGSITDETGERVTWNSPETVAGVKWLQETYTGEKYRPMLPPGIESWTDTSNNENYLAGKIGMTSNAFTVYGKMKQDKNPLLEQTVVMRNPTANDGTVLESGGNGWFSIFRGAQNIDLAKKVILHLLDPANFMSMVQQGGGLFLPAYKNLWTEEVTSIDPNFASLREIIFSPTPFTGFAWPADPNAAIDAVTAAAIQSEMMANVTTGNMTAEEAVEDAHNKIVRIFEELGLPQS
jgi:multiple sugar transport system substrate-binding protein